jgi:hypothetical protein
MIVGRMDFFPRPEIFNDSAHWAGGCPYSHRHHTDRAADD